jgi:dihydroxyacetone kinase-like protein
MSEDVVTADDVIAALRTVAEEIEKAKDHLCALDGASGDGDLGVTMVLGFRAITKTLETADASDIGPVLVKAGAAFSSSAPSSMGALVGTALMRAGQEAKGRAHLSLSDIARMAQAAERGIRDRGKAELGDKTILDAVSPAVAALVDRAANGTSLLAAIAHADAEARRGLEATANMKAKKGRAAWLGERTVGNPDAGAACFCLMLQSALRCLGEKEDRQAKSLLEGSEK